MKRVQTILLILFACVLCRAQIGIKIEAKRSRFLKYEPIEITLTLRNYSGNTLVFGKDAQGRPQGRILFSVKTRSNEIVRPIDPTANPIAGLIFAPGESRELKLTLNSLYDLQNDDYYFVSAYIEHNRIAKAFESNQLAFEVREGYILYKKEIGLPAKNENDPIRTITATLMRFNDVESDIYCLRIDDDERVYGTFRIGPYIQGSKPQRDADEASAIHVLIQIRPKIYKYAVYSVINGEAKIRIEKYYVPDVGVPTLSRSTGYLKVLYAKQALEGVDFRYETKKQ